PDLVGYAHAARPHARPRLEGKSRARAQAAQASGFRLAADQHGDRTPAQRASRAILRSGGIACAADRSSHARAMARRRALSVAHGPALPAPSPPPACARSPPRARRTRKEDFSPVDLLPTKRR